MMELSELREFMNLKPEERTNLSRIASMRLSENGISSSKCLG